MNRLLRLAKNSANAAKRAGLNPRTLAPIAYLSGFLVFSLLFLCSCASAPRRAYPQARCFVIDRYIGVNEEAARKAALKMEAVPSDINAMIQEIIRLDNEVRE